MVPGAKVIKFVEWCFVPVFGEVEVVLAVAERESLSLSGGFTPFRHLRHLRGENIQSYNLFSPVMMIT